MAVSRTSIPNYLARVRALVLRHEARRTGLYGFAALAGIVLVLPLVGAVIGAHRGPGLAVLAIGGIAAAIVVAGSVVLGLVAPRRRYGADADVARWVGRRHPPVASDLLSCVELAEAPVRPGAPSRALVSALADATGAKLDDVAPDSLLPVRELPRARRWALAVVAANLVLVALLPGIVGRGWHHLVAAPPDPYDGAALSDVPLVGDLNATLTFPAYAKRRPVELPSSSGDVRGLPGTSVALRARVLVPASEVELVIEPAPGAAGAKRKVAAKLDGDQVSASLVIDRAARYRFAVTSPSGGRSIETTPRSIETEPDVAPTVQLVAPGEPLDVANVRRVELAYVIEDDFGLTSAELVWESGKDRGKKPIPLDDPGSRAQGKLVWDIAEVQVPSGGEVRYWIEAKDNDTIGGPNVGRSRELHLRVTSPRERHEETLARQQAVAERLLKNLGARLVGPGDDGPARDGLAHDLRDAVVELGSVAGAYDKDPHASDQLRKALSGMRDRLDRLASAEQRLLIKGAPKMPAVRFAATDPRIVAELEDDAISLADWLDRERLEGLLDISDEIAAHQKRLADLLAQFQRTKDPRLLDEIDREMKALDRLYAEQTAHAHAMPEDVLDQYVNRDAAKAQDGSRCMDEVRALVHAGKTAEAQAKLEVCRQEQARAAAAQEDSLSAYRGDKFGEEQKKLDEVMNELADVAKDQDDIAAEANRIFEAYAQKADEIARDHRREAAKKIGAVVDKLRRRLDAIDQSGLTPFAKEELDVVERRLNDVEHMVGDGDLAEGAAMARQAKQSLDTIAGELEAALDDDRQSDSTSKWAEATQNALDGVERARPVAKDLIDELQALAPRPDQIMSGDDQRALDRLRRREAMNEQRTRRLGDRTKQLGGELPGDTASELGKKLGAAIDQMDQADDRMKAKDPSGARETTRAAADALAKARDRARSAARQAQKSVVGEEPIRIPGADEYRAPEKFREQLLEDWKKGSAPKSYEDADERYIEELRK
ncbi:MAG TPA: hypothetical protein VGF94_12625 [Kofleriaceae bacterium]